MTRRQISNGLATGALVLGIIQILIGIVVAICSFVLASKVKTNASLTPYWAGLTVSKYLRLFYYLFIKVFCFRNNRSQVFYKKLF